MLSMFGNTLRELRKSYNLTQIELAQKLDLSFSTISMYERGEREPDFETLEAIADFFNVSMDYLHGKEYAPSNITPVKWRTVPLLGTIACGEPILAEENIEDDIQCPENIKADFALRCKGDSMIDARVYDGDIVYIRQQPTVENGQIAAVLIGDEATLKRVYISDGIVTLSPCNSKYQPLVFAGNTLGKVRIIGKAVAFTSTHI